MPHPDLESEQAHVDRALACLEAMRAATARLVDGEFGGTEVDSAIVRAELETRLRSLSEQHGPLTFGRIDEEDGPRHYIGRRHVKDHNDEPVVVDWRAPVAAPFYRATIRDPLGLRLRRRFAFDHRRLLDIFEEDFADPDSVAAGHGGVPDPLLAELGRTRSGDMRDIVATIQGEQGFSAAGFLSRSPIQMRSPASSTTCAWQRLFGEHVSTRSPGLGRT